MEHSSWEVIAFESARGEQPVEEFIKSLAKATISKFTQEADLLERYGPFLKMPHSKKITRDLYELRIRGRQEVRIIYGFKHNRIYLLHAFLKKTQQIPSKEIKIAEQRFSILR